MSRVLWIVLLAVVAVASVASAAEAYPTRTITIVNPFPPGGLADLTMIGLFAPRSTPPAILKVLREAVRKGVQEPDFKGAMDKIQVPIAYQDADDFKAWWDKDAQTSTAVIKRIGKVETR